MGQGLIQSLLTVLRLMLASHPSIIRETIMIHVTLESRCIG